MSFTTPASEKGQQSAVKRDRRGGKRTGESEHERRRAADEEDDGNVEQERGARVDDQERQSDGRDDLLERRPALVDRDQERVQSSAHGGVVCTQCRKSQLHVRCTA